MEKSFGSVHYEAQMLDLAGIDGEKIYDEISQKICSGCPLDGRDKLSLVFLPFMKHSLPFGEALSKVLLLI